MRLGVQFFHDPFAYYRHTTEQRAMLLALYDLETGTRTFEPAAKAAPAKKPKANAKAAAGLKPTTVENIARLREKLRG